LLSIINTVVSYYQHIWLVVSTPLKNMSSSVGFIIPNLMESHKIHVPNHQPDIIPVSDVMGFPQGLARLGWYIPLSHGCILCISRQATIKKMAKARFLVVKPSMFDVKKPLCHYSLIVRPC
jgi:hypothetical protein